VNLQVASFTDVTGFQGTECDGDTIIWVQSIDYVGEGGPYGNMYYSEQELGGMTNEPLECTRNVRAIGEGDQYGPWAEFTYIVGDPNVGDTLKVVTPGSPPMLLTPTPTLFINPQIIFTDTPASKSFQATVLKNANCRAGPGTAYNEWGYAMKGEVVEVVGRNEDGTWLNVINPHATGKCWLSIIALEFPFDVSVLPPDSYPTPPPSEGGDDSTTRQGCYVRSASGGETLCVSPCPPGAVPGTSCTP
jgi:hypothetical protein